MVVQWATMSYEVKEEETLIKYIVCHDTDAELAIHVMVEPIGAVVHMSTIREEHFDGIYTTFRILYKTIADVQVTLTWV